MILFYILTILLDCMHVFCEDNNERIFNLYDSEDKHKELQGALTTVNIEFEPIIPMVGKGKEKQVILKNIDCEEFSKYALNCTMDAALMYNSSKKAPPLPSKINDWCRAIRHLTNCAIDWNSDCREVTESHFNEESIRGHMHVVANVCDDDWFLSKYDILYSCIYAASHRWEHCYTMFKRIVDEQKNTSHDWTHFQIHFYMCCARAQFRRCTLDALFDMPTVCPYDQAITLQKFSVIVSEGDVFQDCDHNMMYINCPGGDPRPSRESLIKFMNADSYKNEEFDVTNRISRLQSDLSILVFFIWCFIILSGFVK